MNATEAFLRYVLSILVKHPEKMQLTKSENDKEIQFQLKVAHDDAGRIIGRNGRTISAIRSLMQVSAGRVNKHAVLILQGEEQHPTTASNNSSKIPSNKVDLHSSPHAG